MKRSIYDVMVRVKDLKMLRDNATELARIEGYKTLWEMYNDGIMDIYDDHISVRVYNAPSHLSKEIDYTYTVLIELYATNEDWEDYEDILIHHLELEDIELKRIKGEF